MSKETIELIKPLKVNGKDYKKLDYDLEKISIEHITKAEAEKTKMLGRNAAAGMKIAQSDYLLQTFIGMQAIIMCQPEIDVEDLKRITGYDLVQIQSAGLRFFIPPTSQTAETSEKSQEVTAESSTAQ